MRWQRQAKGRVSTGDEMAQPPCLLSRSALQLLIAEGLLRPLLRGDHVVFIDVEAGAAGQGQEIGQFLRFMQLAIERRIAVGMGEEGIELVQAHGRDRLAVAPV